MNMAKTKNDDTVRPDGITRRVESETKVSGRGGFPSRHTVERVVWLTPDGARFKTLREAREHKVLIFEELSPEELETRDANAAAMIADAAASVERIRATPRSRHFARLAPMGAWADLQAANPVGALQMRNRAFDAAEGVTHTKSGKPVPEFKGPAWMLETARYIVGLERDARLPHERVDALPDCFRVDYSPGPFASTYHVDPDGPHGDAVPLVFFDAKTQSVFFDKVDAGFFVRGAGRDIGAHLFFRRVAKGGSR